MAKPKNNLNLTADYVRKIFDYDSETGIFTWKWREDVGYNWNARFFNKVAGSVDSKGYRHIKIGSRLYKAHRIAILYMTGEWPVDQVDHINGMRDDNSWNNLREATNAENTRNSKCSNRNKLGIKGVYFCNKHRKFVAHISQNGSMKFLGFFDTPEEAKEVRDKNAKKEYGKFFNEG